MKKRGKGGSIARVQAAGTAPSLQSQVLEAVVAVLGGSAANVYRTRMESFAPAQLPADNVLPADELAKNVTSGSIDLVHTFHVRHTAAAVNEVDKVVDARYVRAQQLILADPLLGGLVRFTRYKGRKWEFEKGEVDTVALVVTYEVEFSTSRSDPSLPGI